MSEETKSMDGESKNNPENAVKQEVEKADEKVAETPQKSDKSKETKSSTTKTGTTAAASAKKTTAKTKAAAEEKKTESLEEPAEAADVKAEVTEAKKEKAEAADVKAEVTEAKEEKVEAADVKAEGTEAKEEKAEAADVKAEADAPLKEEETKPVETQLAAPTSLGDSAGDFDWDNFGQKEDVAMDSERVKFENLYNETLSTIAEAEVIDGTVISMNKREVVINIGFKSEGVVSLNEFRYNPELAIGDTVEVYVESQEDKRGQLVLSHKQARAMRSWDRVNAALDQDEIIKGYIKCRTKGGMIVDVFGIEAFLPGSQIDVKPIRDYDAYVSKTMEFKVVKINHEFKNVVVSHKALIEAELEQQKKEITASTSSPTFKNS